MIEVWFDDKYKEFFYTREPMARFLDMGNITQQLEMKKRLNCKSFAWFMEEVAYDVLDKYPELPPNVHWGEVRNYFEFWTLDGACLTFIQIIGKSKNTPMSEMKIDITCAL